jgi:hypothetical protein
LELDVVEVELSWGGGLCLNGRKSRETVADVEVVALEAVDDVDMVPLAVVLAEEQLAELEVVEVAVNDVGLCGSTDVHSLTHVFANELLRGNSMRVVLSIPTKWRRLSKLIWNGVIST